MNQIKRFLFIFLVVCMELALISCSNGKNVSDNGSNNSLPIENASQTKNGNGDQKINNSGDTVGNTDISDESKSSFDKTAPPVEYSWRFAFSDGVAWTVSRNINDVKWHLIDTSGNIILVLNDLDEYFIPSNFTHGAAIVKRADGTYELINKTGNVLTSSKADEYDEIIYAAVEIGLFVVKKSIDMFALTETQIGTIDSKGNWHIPLKKKDDWIPISFSEIEYIGDGLIKDKYQDGNMYNLYTGESFHCYPRRFNDGYGVYRKGNNVYSMNTFGEINEIKNGLTWTELRFTTRMRGNESEEHRMNYYFAPDGLGIYNVGLFYLEDKGYDWNIRGFFDINGNIVIDLSQYKGVLNDPVFDGDYCALILTNEQKSKFYTVIDKTGKFMFEPKSISDLGNEVDFINLDAGLIMVWDWFKKLQVFNIYGEKVFEISKIESFFKFNDGIGLVYAYKDDGNGLESYYIDTSGNRLLF